MSPIRERVRRWIVYLLEKRRMSQSDFARRLDFPTSNVCEMCAGHRGFPWERLDEIAVILGVPTATLFLDDPDRWSGPRDRRKWHRRSGMDRRRGQAA